MPSVLPSPSFRAIRFPVMPDASLLPAFPKLRPAQLRALRGRLQLSIRDAGQTELTAGTGTFDAGAGVTEAAHHAAFWQLEPTPLVIDSSEWALLEAALSQRARFANALLGDLYDRQEVLKQKIFPPEIVLLDPYYRRPCLGLDPGRESPATLLRFDLVKTAAGWHILDTRANTPTGLSYAVQNRRFMAQEAGNLYGELPDFHSIINFPLRLLDALKRLSPRDASDTSAIVLTAGPRDPFYSEHSFLARKMGLPLARGDDLLVLDNCVYFKTISGLERVDVIYRRLNDAHIDPVVFSTDRETVGIPGLLQCIRAGNVVVANAIGSGVAENRALDAFLPRLMRFYLGEKPLLPPVPTYTCGDNDQLEFILDSRDRLRIRPVHDPRIGDPRLHERSPILLDENGLAHTVLENPFSYVAQQIVRPLTLGPDHGFTFSAFVLCQGKHFTVMPGGLVRIGLGDAPIDRVGISADAVVLQGSTVPTDEGADVERRPAQPPHLALGSRAAENLFWLGRYLERAEVTARMLSIFEDVALEEIPARDRRRWLPIWRGLFEATGHVGEKLTARTSPQATLSTDLAWRMSLDAEHPSSIYSSVSIACENARHLRDYVSPEVWTILMRLLDKLEMLRRRALSTRHPELSAERRRKHALLSTEQVMADLNAFLGTAERTMLQDAGWHFLRMGLQLERAIMTCSALRHVLGALDALKPGEPVGPAKAASTGRDNPELSALLRMLGSQDAYRRLYQTRSQPRLVAELFLQQLDAPRSIFHNLHQIKTSLRAIRLDTRESEEREPTELAVSETLQFLAALRIGRHFGSESPALGEKPQKLADLLAELLSRLYALHPLLSDHYFSHQARVTGTAQAELKL